MTQRPHKQARPDKPFVRNSVLLSQETDAALRRLAEHAERPLTWEIRRALEEYVEREQVAA